jgi:PAS domain S-box-containing protein
MKESGESRREKQRHPVPGAEAVPAAVGGVTGGAAAGLTLQNSERGIRDMLETMHLAAVQLDTRGRVSYCSEYFCALTGWTREEILGQDWFEKFIPPEMQEEMRRLFTAIHNPAIEFPKRHENDILTCSGERRLVLWSNNVFRDQENRPVGVTAIGQDITERRQAEDLLRQSEERYRNILESIQEGYYEVNLHGDFTFFNEPLCRIFGYAPDEMMGLNYHQYYRDAEAIAKVQKTYRRVYDTGEVVKLSDWRIVRKDGSDAILTVSVALMRDREGNPRGFRGIARDVTEHRQAERALQEAETRYRELFENANDIIYTHDLDGRFTSLNKAGEQISGYTREEARQLNAIEILAPKYREMARDMVRRKLIRDDPTRYEAAILAKDGRIVPLEISTRIMVENGQPVGVQGIARDITERKTAEEERRRLEAQIQHTQKLEGLGVLAGGIAHDFNNLLVGIMGNAGLALSRLPEESPARNYVRRIEETSQRAAELTNQMLAYSGRGTFLVRALDLSKLAREMGPLLTASISKKAVLRYDCTPDLPLIKGDVAQLHQIMMNLITNASDALGDHAGVIGISTYVMHVDRLYLKKTYVADELVEGPYVCLAVSDTGCGMSPDTLARMFDPFFSTKFAGRGLGLASVLGIVRGHKGAITVYSELGQGTTFKVLFPVAEYAENGAVRERAARMDPELAAWRGEGTILVADDENAVLEVAQEALEQHGLRVLTAGDGREALELFQAHACTVSAVLLDLMMPVINGAEAADLIHALNPEVPIILTSGYTEQDAAERFQTRAPVTFIQKPYRPQDLVRVIKEVMTTRPPNP